METWEAIAPVLTRKRKLNKQKINNSSWIFEKFEITGKNATTKIRDKSE